jgi:DNA-binding LacI/PurR family transcriptional regulator
MNAGIDVRKQEERKQSDRERKRRAREAMRERGLRPYEVWVTAEEWIGVKRYLDRLAKRRAGSKRGD